VSTPGYLVPDLRNSTHCYFRFAILEVKTSPNKDRVGSTSSRPAVKLSRLQTSSQVRVRVGDGTLRMSLLG
jgi:hypothetical protein